MTEHEQLRPATRTVALGRPSRDAGAPVNAPVTFTSTYAAGAPVNYARVGNPTWSALEEALGGLEGGHALAFASGMAAVDAAVSLVPPGGTLVLPRHAYNGTTSLVGQLEDAGRLVARVVDIADTAAVLSALDGADVLLAETPTNPMLEVADLPRLTTAAHAAGAMVLCDNTFATPLLQQPIAEGVDVVLHSATKYLSGHSDVLLGATITSPDRPDLHERLHTYRTTRGAVPGPMEAWLVLRGLRTLDVRLERAGASAATLAARLAEHPAVARVRYPGFGAIVAFEVSGDDGVEHAERVCAATRLWLHSTSLGGVESQIERRRRHPLEVASVPDELIRLSVGIEHVEDLWADLDQALGS